MLLGPGKLTQPDCHVLRLLNCLSLHQCLDEVRGHREDARVLDAFSLGVVPHNFKVLHGVRGVSFEQGNQAECSLGLQPVPAHPGGLHPVEGRAGPPSSLACVTASRRQKCPTAFVHRPVQQPALG